MLNGDALVFIAYQQEGWTFHQSHCLCSFIRTETLVAKGEIQGEAVTVLH